MTLVEKLRQMIVGSSFGAAMTLDKAASEIDRLTAENERLREALKRLLLEVDFLIEGGYLTDIRDDVIFVAARAALEQP